MALAQINATWQENNRGLGDMDTLCRQRREELRIDRIRQLDGSSPQRIRYALVRYHTKRGSASAPLTHQRQRKPLVIKMVDKNEWYFLLASSQHQSICIVGEPV